MMLYPVDQLYEEMAFIAIHFHWSRDTLMALEHGERRRWCEEISAINLHFNERAPSLLDVT
ncbi:DUF6760 family protein [Kribbella sp. VKM Ac-2568]|uniref:DUF6760 family protein n=1 Tax=Kribbella sp. VKM Ac-2568 TaxID=2512219 RepID=UPI001049AEE7|nr:DUF6760 family protein [Kribbella sp. VKM Ac-2568]TCM35986.1 hypothetical protein EV648_12334 [Kribbella sp. VKM Ac-2568]